MRQLLTLPFLAIGWLAFRTAELIKGEHLTYRADEAIDAIQATAECTECGHKGAVFTYLIK